MSSFFGERTAEYALVPVLQRALKGRFGSAIPVFYWKTREGNRTASEIHGDSSVRVLAVFARRPKLTGQKSRIWGRVNFELFKFASAARAVGIPCIAAFPAVATLYDLYGDPPIFWLPIEQPGDSELIFFTDISSSSPVPVDKDGRPIQILSLEEVLEEVAEKAKILSWDDAMSSISKLRAEDHRQSPSFFGFSWFGGYKPVYFLIVESLPPPTVHSNE